MNFSLEIGLKTDLTNLPKINDVYITKQRREEITDLIVAILEEHGYHEG